MNSSLEVLDFLTLLYIWLGARWELVGVTGVLGEVAGEAKVAPKERTAVSPFESFRPRTFLFDLERQTVIDYKFICNINLVFGKKRKTKILSLLG